MDKDPGDLEAMVRSHRIEGNTWRKSVVLPELHGPRIRTALPLELRSRTKNKAACTMASSVPACLERTHCCLSKHQAVALTNEEQQEGQAHCYGQSKWVLKCLRNFFGHALLHAARWSKTPRVACLEENRIEMTQTVQLNKCNLTRKIHREGSCLSCTVLRAS
jgi:hypothetical protein